MGHVMIDNLFYQLEKLEQDGPSPEAASLKKRLSPNYACLTLRENTERPVTVEIGSNLLIGKDTWLLKREVERILNGEARQGSIPELWDGRASQRIVEVLAKG